MNDDSNAQPAAQWERCNEPGSWHCGSEIMGMTQKYAYRCFPSGWHRLALPASPVPAAPAEQYCDGHCSWLEHQPGCVRAPKFACTEAVKAVPASGVTE